MSDSGKQDTRTGPLWSDLGPRVISAIVLIVVLIAAVFLGGFWFSVLVGGVFAGAYREWEVMVTGKQPSGIGMVLIGMIAVCALAYTAVGISGSLVVMTVAALIAVFAPSDARFWRAGGIFYFCLVVISVLAMRGDSGIGIAVAFYLGFAVWFTDSGAFFFGRQLGGAKLSPDISPAKTWSGALGGLAVGVLTATITWAIVSSSPIWIGALLAIVLSVAGQLGDLAESAIKRRFRVKDSGDVIPGHGGLMDRLDSMSLAVLVLFCVGGLHAGVDAIAQGVLIW